MRYFLFIAALLFCSVSTAQTKIAWFSTIQEDLSDKSGFWSRVHGLIVAAAEDLDVDFKVYYAEESHIRLLSQVNAILSDPKSRPDGIIFHNYKNTGERLLAKAEQYGVKSLIFNAGFTNSDETSLHPRQKYKHWIGEILPDDQFAGAELLEQLYKVATKLEKFSHSKEIKVLALEGNLSSGAYIARKSGFQQKLKELPNATFTQYVPAEWSRESASRKFDTIFYRYPNLRIVWAANDNMALGILDAASKTKGAKPNEDFVVGGVDWLPESFESIKDGRMAVTIGGHFVEGMWALILLYDYLNGFDFADAHGTSLRTQMLAVNKALLGEYGDLTQKLEADRLSQFDFRALSITHKNNGQPYDFSIERFLGSL